MIQYLEENSVIIISYCAGEDASVEYFLKVISLLEQFPCPDLVIYMAETALAICPQDHKVHDGNAPLPLGAAKAGRIYVN